jgi:hypothetical protein
MSISQVFCVESSFTMDGSGAIEEDGTKNIAAGWSMLGFAKTAQPNLTTVDGWI